MKMPTFTLHLLSLLSMFFIFHWFIDIESISIFISTKELCLGFSIPSLRKVILIVFLVWIPLPSLVQEWECHGLFPYCHSHTTLIHLEIKNFKNSLILYILSTFIDKTLTLSSAGHIRLALWSWWRRLELCIGSFPQCYKASQLLWYITGTSLSTSHTEGSPLHVGSKGLTLKLGI